MKIILFLMQSFLYLLLFLFLWLVAGDKIGWLIGIVVFFGVLGGIGQVMRSKPKAKEEAVEQILDEDDDACIHVKINITVEAPEKHG